jgi:hypothetical protein
MREETYYVTKYWMTSGINKVQGHINEHGYLVIPGHYNWFRVEEYFETREAAESHVQKLIDKKIASLEKQIEKLKKMKK